MCSARRRSRSSANGCAIVASGDYKDVADPTCAPFELVPCDVFITEATFGLPVFRHRDADAEIAKLLRSVALFPERAHLVGAYSLGKAQRVIALIRAGRLRQADLSARRDGDASRAITSRAASISASCAWCATRRRRSSPAPSRSARRRRCRTLVAPLSRSGHRLRLRLDAGARARAPARRRTAAGHFRSRRLGRAAPPPSRRPARREIWVTHGAEDALVHWCDTRGLKARPLHIVGYGDEDEADGAADARRGRRLGMNRFAELLDRLAYEPGRNAKLRLIDRLFPHTPDPDRGYALAALTGALVVPARQARHDPRADRRAHRSGAVRAVLRLCRRPVGDGRADVARADRRRRAGADTPRSRASPRRTSSHTPRTLARQGASCRRSSRAGSTRSTRPAAGRC